MNRHLNIGLVHLRAEHEQNYCMSSILQNLIMSAQKRKNLVPERHRSIQHTL